MDPEQRIEELPASKLGTLEHWDEVYDREKKTFNETGDPGECWFGEDSAEQMADWAEEYYAGMETQVNIIDIGCGNGHLLISLAERGFTKLTGIDYSKHAIDLAKGVIEDKFESLGLEIASKDVDLKTIDLLDLNGLDNNISLKEKFNFAVDKGTYDAISLASDKEFRHKYPEAIHKLLDSSKDDHNPSVFLITSCNWTEEELVNIFESSKLFKYLDSIKYPTFEFGGKKGQQISTVAFSKI